MTKFEVLKRGLQLVAKNHFLQANVDDSEGTLCIFGGCNIPLLADVLMLCDDVKFPRVYVEHSEFGIDLNLDEDWVQTIGSTEYTPSKEYSFWKMEHQKIY